MKCLDKQDVVHYNFTRVAPPIWPRHAHWSVLMPSYSSPIIYFLSLHQTLLIPCMAMHGCITFIPHSCSSCAHMVPSLFMPIVMPTISHSSSTLLTHMGLMPTHFSSYALSLCIITHTHHHFISIPVNPRSIHYQLHPVILSTFTFHKTHFPLIISLSRHMYIVHARDSLSPTVAITIAAAAAAKLRKSSGMSVAAAANALAGGGTTHLPQLFSLLSADNQGWRHTSMLSFGGWKW